MRHFYATATETSQVNEALAQGVTSILAALGERFVAYYPSLADLSGSPKAALMLGHAMYMTRVVMEKQPNRGGWFWKTAKEWRKVTGLSAREIETARKVLLKDGIMQESRRGMPAKLWFRVDLDRLSLKLCQYTNTAYRPWSWEDRVLKSLLGKPVMFYAPFAWMADSALAGLYMSSLLGRLRQSLLRDETDPKGWFLSPAQDSLRQLHFGRRMMMNARAKLVSAGMIEESRENRMKSHTLSRIELTTLPAKIALEANRFHSLSDSDKLDCRIPTNNSCLKRVTADAGSAKQELPEARNNSCLNRETSSAETAPHIRNINTTYINQHLHTERVVVENGNFQAQPIGGVIADEVVGQLPIRLISAIDTSKLFYPDKLLPGEKQVALQVLYGCGQPQLLLDELAGQMQDGHVKNVIGYLRKLRSLLLAGSFEPEYANRIAGDRRRRQDILEQRKSSTVPNVISEAERESARGRLSDLRQSMWGSK